MEKDSPINEVREMDSPSPSVSRDVCYENNLDESKESMDMDERNPKNWTKTRKTLLFIALMSSSLLADGYVISNKSFTANSPSQDPLLISI